MSASHSIRGWSPVMLIALSLSLVYPDQSPLIIAQTTSSPSTIIRLREPVPVSGRTTVAIDFAIWYPQKSGRLFSLRLNSSDEISATFFPGYSGEAGDIRFSYCNQRIIGQLALRYSAVNRLTKHSFLLEIDPESRQNRIAIDDNSFQFACDSLQPESIMINVGDQNNWSTIWSWHRLAITSGNTVEETRDVSWNFTELSPNKISRDFIIENQTRPYAGETIIGNQHYDLKTSFLHAVPNQTYRFIINSRDATRQNYLNSPHVLYRVNPLNITPNVDFFWDWRKNILYRYHGGLNPLTDISGDAVAPDSIDTYHYSATPMVDPVTGDFYLVGGYGQYQFQNTINKYNFKEKIWENIPYRSSTPFSPRCGSSIFLQDSAHAFILGGHGNPQGRQEMGRFEYADLWLYSFRDSTLEKIADNLFPNDYLSLSAGFYRPVDNSVYFFYWQPSPDPTKQVSAGLWQITLGDTLSSRELMIFNSTPILDRTLRYDADNDLILYLTSDEKKGTGDNTIFTQAIMFPLRSAPAGGNNPLLMLSISAVIAALIGLGLLNRRVRGALPIPGIGDKILIELNDSMRVFVNGKERDLTDVKLQKALELLKLLAITPGHSLRHTTIKAELWPGVIDESFKNSLYVALTTIRKIIQPYPDALINQGGKVALRSPAKVVIKRDSSSN